ncbi:PREDICTED: myb-like protein X [Papilio polytes]|uniref:myb-like protein X n=1 Tax=Papilio polytes TaxID=76194 RepID=UPI0006769D3E|nr:PREDICTED: myb-like protein X [Papilio polytes]
MKLSIILLIVGLCVVSAKYLPEEWGNADQYLSRFKRFDLGDSDTSSEDDDKFNSKDDDSENSTDETDVREQSKRITNLERMRQKLLEKQEKERLKQEEAQRKIEERIAKELQKEEEKRQKEQRKWEEKLEKERKKLEEEQRKIQEKIVENERKRQETIKKEMEELEKNEQEKQERDSSSSNNDDSDNDSIELEDIWKIHIYSKYGITEENTNVEKKTALRKYMQEELGLNANSTQSERRQAVLRFIQSELQKVPNINILRSQFIDYINYVGVQKIKTKLEGDIEKLKNKTETLDNVNFTWVPIAKQNLAEQVSFLETLKQFLSSLLPNWFNGNTDKQQQGVPVTNAHSIISPESGIVNQQTNDANPTNTINTNSNLRPSNAGDNVSPSNAGDNVSPSNAGDNVSSSNAGDNVSPSNAGGNALSKSPVSENNGASVSTSSSVVSESSVIDLEKPKSSFVDEANPINQLDTVDKTNFQQPSAVETNEATITLKEDTINKQLPSEIDTDTVGVTKNSINELNGDTTVVPKSDTGITNESAQTGITTNSDVRGVGLNEKPSIETDSVNNVNNGAIAENTPTELQANPSVAIASVDDTTNQNIADKVNKNVDSLNKNINSATEYSNNAVAGAAVAVTITDGVITSSSASGSDLSEASSSISNNNENTGTSPSISNEPNLVNIDASTVGSKNLITDTISESSPAVDNSAAASDLTGSVITEASLTSVGSDYIAPSGNTLDESSSTSEDSKNVNKDATQNIPTNSSTNISKNEAGENPLTSNGIQSQVITEAIEVKTPATIVNESSNVVQEQSSPESSNTEQQLINEITTVVTEQGLTAETRLQDVSQASGLNTDSVTQETPVSPPVPVEPGAAIVDVAQQ